MQAVLSTRYGPPEVLELREVDTPDLEPDRVLVRVRAASVNAADWRVLRGQPRVARVMMGGLRAPKDPRRGTDVAGTVEAVGDDVTELRAGDEVFGAAPGAFAEYAAGRERSLVPKPESLTFEQAAAIPIAGVTALQALRDHGRVGAGQRVLINGAAGGVGTFSVQIAKVLGAEVTAVCSTQNVELVRSLGADRVVDYTAEDFTRNGQRYDVIVDNVGNRSLRALRRRLTPRGTLVVVGAQSGAPLGGIGHLLGAVVQNRFVGQNLVAFIAKLKHEDLRYLGELAADGRLTPAIDRTYPLAETREAIRYLETGHARAKVVITI